MQPIALLLLLLIYCSNRTWAALYAHFVAPQEGIYGERGGEKKIHQNIQKRLEVIAKIQQRIFTKCFAIV